MGTFIHKPNYLRKLCKVGVLCRNQWVFFEERDDPVRQVRKPPHRETAQCFPMIVVSVITTNVTTSKERLQQVHRTLALHSLDHREGRLGLPTEPARSIHEDWNAEAALAVDKADDPLRKSWPFLLIARTGWIFTFHDTTLTTECDTNEYHQILGVSSIWPAALCKITLARGSPWARIQGGLP